MAKRNDLVPYERPQARKWTRIGDYVHDAEARIGGVDWPAPGTLPLRGAVTEVRRPSARGFLLAVGAVVLAAILSLWASGTFRPAEPQGAAVQTSRGLVFGLCSEGGLTNCVASGDSFYLNGKTVRVAGIEAPRLYGASCPKEVDLGRTSAAKLQGLLNSGEIEMRKVAQDLDSFGLLLRDVAVSGKDVAAAMTSAGLARDMGSTPPNWC